MRRVILRGSLAASFLLCGAAIEATHASDDFTLPDFAFPNASPAIDLANTPLWLEIFSTINLELRDKLLRSELEAKTNELLPSIREAIAEFRAGYLVRVNVFVDAAGIPIIPGGEIITPLGLGVEPLDALAEHYRRPRMEAPRPRKAVNGTVYFWFTQKEGKLNAQLIPNAFREAFERRAVKEGDRRRLMASWRPYAGGDAKIIQRADYWADVLARYSDHVRDNGRKQRIAALTSEAKRLQAEISAKYLEHTRAVLEIAENQRSLAVLQNIKGILDIVNAGVAAGKLVSSNDTKVSAMGEAAEPVKDLMQYRKIREIESNGVKVRTETEITISSQALQKIDQNLADEWKGSGVPVQKPDTIPIPIVPLQ